MLAILKREMRNYFTSPIGYVYLAVFYFFAGFYFFGSTVLPNTTDLSNVFSSLFIISLFVLPILTMRLMSEDLKNKTDQALLTAPISLFSLVMGKYLAALVMFVVGISVTLAYALVIALFSTPDWAMLAGHFIGLFLLGCALAAIGMFISSLTENQVVAAAGAFAASLGLMLVDGLSSLTQNTLLKKIMDGLSFNSHYTSFTQGMLSLKDVVFFLSICAVFLFLTVRVFEKRRWN